MSDNDVKGTICRDCKWAVYDGNEQVNCELGRIVAYKNNGVEIVSGTDNNLDFYVIRDKICVAHRQKDWDGDSHQLYKEIEPKIDYVFDVGFNRIELVQRSLATVKNPNSVILVRRTLDVSLYKLQELAKGFNKWFIVDAGEVSYQEAENAAVKNCTGTHYLWAHVGYEVPTNLFETIDNYLNRKLKQFAVIKDGDARITNTKLFNLLGGNSEKLTITGKILELAKEQGSEYLVKDWKDLVNER